MLSAVTSLERWRTVWRELGASKVDDKLYHRLVACYSEPHRKYHTIQHLNECFTHLNRMRSLAGHAAEVELALWFHDAIYNTSKKDNEQRSAKWASECALEGGLKSEPAGRIYELIMATMHNAVPEGRDAEVLVDIDLGILGADPARFDGYEIQVREEYSWVPEFMYRAARRKVLQEFMRREWIYSTEVFRSEHEARARENLKRSLSRL